MEVLVRVEWVAVSLRRDGMLDCVLVDRFIRQNQ